ncbi:MAG TPA: ACP S-malonyltransferase, partial [Nitrospiria bacterium]|nr:ACP S-malonyltransferase [Nitrospiria bacterium]
MNTALLFPGQGSQYVGMGARIAESDEQSGRLFDEASSVLGFDLLSLCRSGPEERLNLTEFTQPAILTASCAAWDLLNREGIKPVFLAGHSLGEYSALVAAGALDFRDAVRVVHKRGQFMQQAVPAGSGAMAAILGMDRSDVELVCREASSKGLVSPANYNSPVQTVIGGEKKAVEAASVLARNKGAKRVVPLSVSVPSHCDLMKPAVEKLKPELEKVRFGDLGTPVVTNVDARANSSGEEARDSLLRQLAKPVRWVETIEWMVGEGV